MHTTGEFTTHNVDELNIILNEQQKNENIVKQRQRKVLKSRTIQQALNAPATFQFSAFADFRGRVYLNGWGLSPQGKDLGKGLLRYTEGLRLGVDGLEELAAAVATYWGEDKVSPAERAKWTRVKTEWLREVVEGAAAHTDFTWRLAGEPTMFLACAQDWIAANNNPDYVSYLGRHVDATNSGLQILAALNHDGAAGVMVNVRPRADGLRADAYLACRDKVQAQLEALAASDDAKDADKAAAAFWLDFGLSRNLFKRPVMTFVYSATPMTFTFQIIEESGLTGKDGWKMAGFLASQIWEAVEELLPGPFAVMKWLQECAGILAAVGKGIDFTSHHGLRIVQANCERKRVKAFAKLRQGRIKPILWVKTDRLSVNKQKSAIAPNIVHHFDALLVQAVAARLPQEGVHNFQIIHDSFNARFGEMGTLNRVIREEFAKLFAGNPLEELRMGLEAASGVTLPAPPAMGDMDPAEILNSVFAFS